MTRFFPLLSVALLFTFPATARDYPAEQLAGWLKQFPEADANKDGTLTSEEADAFRRKMQRGRSGNPSKGGAPRKFDVDPGWDEPDFPAHAVSNKSPEEIAAIYEEKKDRGPTVMSYEKPEDGALRVIGTGHSFMAPGYWALPKIAQATGFEIQPLYTHVGGGMTGSTRYKWEQENGIFQFEGKPLPKLLASLANAEWDIMMWGPYFNDRPEYYSCWIEFALKHQPDMKFYLSDAWPQLYQLAGDPPESEADFTEEIFDRIGTEKRELYAGLIEILREKHGERVFIMPTSDAMTNAAKRFLRGELPGVEGINRVIGGKEKSLWRDTLGHLGPGFERLEGYVFYATIYGRSPELIDGDIPFGNSPKMNQPGYPSEELDRIFRKIAWEAVSGHRFSGVRDNDGNGISDDVGTTE